VPEDIIYHEGDEGIHEASCEYMAMRRERLRTSYSHRKRLDTYTKIFTNIEYASHRGDLRKLIIGKSCLNNHTQSSQTVLKKSCTRSNEVPVSLPAQRKIVHHGLDAHSHHAHPFYELGGITTVTSASSIASCSQPLISIYKCRCRVISFGVILSRPHKKAI
jgi:hypothetical protein